MGKNVSSDADEQRAIGFAAGRKWAEGPAEFIQLQRIADKVGDGVERLCGAGDAAAAIAAACFNQPGDENRTRKFWSAAAGIEPPGDAFIRGFYEGLRFVFDEMIITAIR